MNRRAILVGLLLAGRLGLSLLAAPESETDSNKRERHPQTSGTSFHLDVPAHDFDLILARPEDRSVTASILAYRALEGVITFGADSGHATVQRTAPFHAKAGTPIMVPIGPLEPDRGYACELALRFDSNRPFQAATKFHVHTARPPGSTFRFTMTADVHLDEHTSGTVYLQSLAGIRADAPDFHIDLGNLFMTDKHHAREEAQNAYLAQRYYLSQIGTPLLLALGVHDGESSKYHDGTAESLATWSNGIRKQYFPNPEPDRFYSGDTTPNPLYGLPQDYYAWTWGDALFVVLDPFRYSNSAHGGLADGWGWSLGRSQYDWLEKTIRESTARYKFVFLHNLLAGDQASRGGIEIAGRNEWGGKNADGTEGFAEHRPGWPMPVHSLLVKHHVTAVFKAHDNFYARQELDGIVYLMVPQPSFAGNDRIRDLENYGYKQGVFLGNTGYVRVSVGPESAKVEYMKLGKSDGPADSCVLPGAGSK